jgi:hypothetical protein
MAIPETAVTKTAVFAYVEWSLGVTYRPSALDAETISPFRQRTLTPTPPSGRNRFDGRQYDVSRNRLIPFQTGDFQPLPEVFPGTQTGQKLAVLANGFVHINRLISCRLGNEDEK